MHQTVAFQLAQPFAQGRACDPELSGKLGLARQLVAGVEVAAQDLRLDLVGDLLVGKVYLCRLARGLHVSTR